MNPGDLLLTHRKGLASTAIVAGQRLRFTGERRHYARWSHAAILTTTTGDLVEAWWSGVRESHINEYANVEHVIIPIDSNNQTRARVVRFATHQIGRRYGYLEIASLAGYLLTGSTIRLGLDGQMICSGLAAGALSRTDAIFAKEPMFCLPADLAEHYAVD